MIRVLHVSAAGVYGGNEEHLRTLFAHLDRARIETHLAAPPGSSLAARSAELGIRVYPLTLRSGNDFGALLALRRILRESGASILHTHNRWEDGLGAVLGALVPGCLWMTTLHDRVNMDQEGHRVRTLRARIYARLLRGARLALANSRATARDAVEDLGLDPARVVAITNGQDLARLEGVRPDASALPPAACRFGLVARVRGTAIQKKGIPEFLEAAGMVLRGGADASFTLVGGDEAAGSEIRRLAAAAGIPPERLAVRPFAGDARPLMAALDVLVCPSRFEGLPRSLMEVMGLGRAVIGTAVDGIAEIIEDGISGALVPPRDPGRLAEAMKRLSGNPSLRGKMGWAAARRVRELYGAARMASEHEDAYRRLSGASSSRS